MTVKDLMELLQFFPPQAEVCIETRDQQFKTFHEVTEHLKANHQPMVILSLKDQRPRLRKVN